MDTAVVSSRLVDPAHGLRFPASVKNRHIRSECVQRLARCRIGVGANRLAVEDIVCGIQVKLSSVTGQSRTYGIGPHGPGGPAQTHKFKKRSRKNRCSTGPGARLLGN